MIYSNFFVKSQIPSFCTTYKLAYHAERIQPQLCVFLGKSEKDCERKVNKNLNFREAS